MFLMISLVCVLAFIVAAVLGSAVDAFDDGGDGPFGWLVSVQSLLLFGTGFGATGAIASGTGVQETWFVTVIATGGGLGFALLGAKVVAVLRGQESDSTPVANDLVGCTGMVVEPIGLDHPGQVMLLDRRGHTRYIAAYADKQIDPPAAVVVKSVIGADVMVAATFKYEGATR